MCLEQELTKEHIPLPVEQLASWLPVLLSWPPLQLWGIARKTVRTPGNFDKPLTAPPLWMQANEGFHIEPILISIILGILMLVFVQTFHGVNTRHWEVPNQYKKQCHQIFRREYKCLNWFQIVLLHHFRTHFKRQQSTAISFNTATTWIWRWWGLPDGLLSLGLANLRLLVPLGHDLSQGGSSDCPLELHSASAALLCHLFLFNKKIIKHYTHWYKRNN